MKSKDHPVSEFTKWFQNSNTIKLGVIAFLVLILLIPAAMIQELIDERKNYSHQVADEIGINWSGSQLLKGPVLTIPIDYESTSSGEETIVTRQHHILPEKLIIDGNIIPKTLAKGIYEAVVYQSKINLSGSMDLTPQWNTDRLVEVHYDKAFLTVGISDLKGIKEGMRVNWDDRLYEIEPGSRIPDIVKTGISIDLTGLESDLSSLVNFDIELNLNGSNDISFIPIGKKTQVHMESSWDSPEFSGNFLPDTREVSKKGFAASWQILEFNRNFPQFWTGTEMNGDMDESAFGVNLILPVDNYKKSQRSVKYAILIIALTFLIFFLVEVTGKKKIHPFQYGLVGLALSLFYILLLALSEYIVFDLAYGVSALGIIILISLYSLSVFHKKRKSVLLFLVLSGIYGFLYIVLRLEDYALLIGSLGLVVILAIVMYFTRNISWYNSGIKERE